MREKAHQTAEGLLAQMNRTYRNYEPHSIWECYSPTADKPANGKKKPVVRKDFCGWSALGPISLFIENVIGIYEIEKTEILQLDPFLKFGKPAKIAGYVGGRDGYRKAVHELERLIYTDEAV